MKTEGEVQCSLSKSVSVEQIHNELEKTCNKSSTTFCTASDSKRYHGNLPKDSQPENVFPGSALLRPNGSVAAEITAPKVQGSSHHLHSSSEHNNASTGLSQPSGDSDLHDAEPLRNAGRGHGIQAKHTFPKPGYKFIGRGAAPQCPDDTSSQTIQDGNSSLSHKSVNRYLTPHRRNFHSRTEVKYLKADSPGLMRKHKPIEGKQYNVSDQYKQNWGQKTHRKGSRSHDGILGRGYQSNKGVLSSCSDSAWTCSSEHASASAGKSPATNSARYLEKGFQTKSFSHSPVLEDDNINAERKSFMFPSSEYVDQISEGEKKLAGGISTGSENCEVHTKFTEYADENESKKNSCQRNEVSVTSVTCSVDPEQGKYEPANSLEMSENHTPQHHCKLSDAVEEQSNVSSHSRPDSSQLLALSEKSIDAMNLEAESSKLNSFNGTTNGSLDSSEDHSSKNQCKEYYDVKNAQQSDASHSGSSHNLIDLPREGKDEADVAAVCSNLNSSFAKSTDSFGEDGSMKFHDWVEQSDSVPMADRNSSDNRRLRGSYSYPRSPKNTWISPFRRSQVRTSASKIHSYDSIRLAVSHPEAYQMMIPRGFPQQSNGLPIGAHSGLLGYCSSWLRQQLYQIDGMPNPGDNRFSRTEEAKEIYPWLPQSSLF